MCKDCAPTLNLLLAKAPQLDWFYLTPYCVHRKLLSLSNVRLQNASARPRPLLQNKSDRAGSTTSASDLAALVSTAIASNSRLEQHVLSATQQMAEERTAPPCHQPLASIRSARVRASPRVTHRECTCSQHLLCSRRVLPVAGTSMAAGIWTKQRRMDHLGARRVSDAALIGPGLTKLCRNGGTS
jgi:hypothetical protein